MKCCGYKLLSFGESEEVSVCMLEGHTGVDSSCVSHKATFVIL